MKKYFIAILALLIFANTQYVSANIKEESVEDEFAPILLQGYADEKEIYSYSNYAESLESAGASIDIITRKEIEKQSVPTFSELLNQFTSVNVQNANGSLGSPSSIRMRGTDRVRLTIDGVRADRPSMTSSGVEPQFLLSDDIEKIEVIRGPQGNLAGTNASGGLIALQTRKGRGPFKMEIGSEMGNYSSFKERFAIMGEKNGFDYYSSLTWFKTAGGMRTSTLGNIKNDDYNNLSLVTNFGKKLFDDKAEVRNIFRFSRARKNIGIGTKQVFPYDNYQSPNNYSLNYDISEVLSFAHTPNHLYNYDVKFSIFHNESDTFILPDIFCGDFLYSSVSKINSSRLNFKTQHNIRLASWNTLSIGYNLEAENISGRTRDTGIWTGIFSNKYSGATLQNDIFINDLINIKDILFIRGGARLTHHSDFGTYVSPNASMAVVLPTFNIKNAKTKFRASWGESINNPTLYQRFGTFNSSYMLSLANPNLKAERMKSWEVGLSQSFFDEKLIFDVGYFDSNYNNYIGYKGETDPFSFMYIGQYVNVDKAKIQGVEGKVTWKPKKWFRVTSSYTYMKSKDEVTGGDLAACPEFSFKTILYWTPHKKIDVFAGVDALSGIYMSSSKNAEKTSGYVDVKLGANLELLKTENIKISLKGVVYNLLNQNISMYKTANTIYYAPKISFRIGVFTEILFPEKKKNENKSKKENL